MNTKVLRASGDADYWNHIRAAAAALASGQIVVFPTETVYGVGVNAADPAALERLRRLKGRTDGKPFTVHIGSRSRLEDFVPGLQGLGRRLVDKAWPGPLTLIFHVADPLQTGIVREHGPQTASALYYQGDIGLRCPDDRVAADLLTETRLPVVAASANLAGGQAAVDVHEALEALGDEVDLALDGGRSRYARASTIVRVRRDGYDLVREGVIDARTLRRLAQVGFLLVCAGNTCRSPMAEAMLKRLLAERLGCPGDKLAERGYHVESAGLSAMDGIPASPEAVRVLAARGVDLSGHRSRALTPEMLGRADFIYVMTSGQAQAAARMSPSAAGRLRRIDDQDIEDPIGGDEREYAACADRIEAALRRRLEEAAF